MTPTAMTPVPGMLVQVEAGRYTCDLTHRGGGQWLVTRASDQWHVTERGGPEIGATFVGLAEVRAYLAAQVPRIEVDVLHLRRALAALDTAATLDGELLSGQQERSIVALRTAMRDAGHTL